MFVIEGTAFKFVHHTKVEQAYQAGILTETAWNRFQEGRKQYLTKHLTMCKNNKMMVCKNCEKKYFPTNNNPGNCNKGEK